MIKLLFSQLINFLGCSKNVEIIRQIGLDVVDGVLHLRIEFLILVALHDLILHMDRLIKHLCHLE